MPGWKIECHFTWILWAKENNGKNDDIKFKNDPKASQPAPENHLLYKIHVKIRNISKLAIFSAWAWRIKYGALIGEFWWILAFQKADVIAVRLLMSRNFFPGQNGLKFDVKRWNSIFSVYFISVIGHGYNKCRFSRLISMNLSVSESKYCCVWNPGGLDFLNPGKIRQKLTIRVESDFFS